jgi:hypothetical protein
MQGGDPTKKGVEVSPASLSVLESTTAGFELAPDASEAERRLAFAHWIVRADNPLTARVLANRLWQFHFGTGLVDTPSDFGYLGGRPTHPELLDWLARRLHHYGWRLKPLHREIMLSQTYQQAGVQRETAAQLDKEARFLWRFPPRRLSAEEIRDTILSVTGKLDRRMGGPGFRLYQYLEDNVATYVPLDRHGPDTYRRAVYHQNARASRIDLLTDFDCPDSAFSAATRVATTTPLQALTLMNHRFTVEMAEYLGTRLERESGNEPAAQVQRAFLLAFARSPSTEEARAAEQIIRKHGLRAFCRALLNANELVYLD